MKIVVKRVEYKEETKKESIDCESKEEYSDSMNEGESEVTRKGEKGEKEVTYKVKYVDGKEESREKKSEKVTKQPVDKIVTYGTHTESQGAETRAETQTRSRSFPKLPFMTATVRDTVIMK